MKYEAIVDVMFKVMLGSTGIVVLVFAYASRIAVMS